MMYNDVREVGLLNKAALLSDTTLFQVYNESGRTGLVVMLSGLPVVALKLMCRAYCLDCSRSFERMNDSRQLADFMAYRIKCMVTKGEVFR